MQKPAGFDTVCRWLYRALLPLVIALTFGAPTALHAQFTSVIDGRVSDPSDAAVPNAEVTVENTATGVKRVVRTSDVGYYRVASLAPGQYTISVTAPGFDTARPHPFVSSCLGDGPSTVHSCIASLLPAFRPCRTNSVCGFAQLAFVSVPSTEMVSSGSNCDCEWCAAT